MSAELGNPHAQFCLGVMYKDGEGVQRSAEKAAEWFIKAAEQGYPEAQLCIGMFYATGSGVPQSFERSAEWIGRAAEQGLAEAQILLSMYYKGGVGVPRSEQESERWKSRAIEQDNEYAIALAKKIDQLRLPRVPVSCEDTLAWIRGLGRKCDKNIFII